VSGAFVGRADDGSDEPVLSVVTTLYRSEPYIREFYRRMVASAEQLTPSFEIVFVDDGSPDGVAAVARELALQDPRVVFVQLSRNFGHHHAALAGLHHSRGRRVFIIDVDLEEQPEWLLDFAREQDACGADVVFGVSAVRNEAAAKKYPSVIFWGLFNRLSETKVPENPCTVRLMTRRYLNALFLLPDRNLFLAGNYAWTGFPQKAVPVEKKVRPTRSSYTLERRMNLFIDAVTSFTSYPLRLIFLTGLGISFMAFVGGLGLIIRKLASPETVFLGWASLMVSVWFVGGIVIAFLGVIGIYVSRVFTEVKARPVYIVADVMGGGARAATPREVP